MTEGSIDVNISAEAGRLLARATGRITAPLTGDVYRTLGLTESSVLNAMVKIIRTDNPSLYSKFKFKNMTKTLHPIEGSEELVGVDHEPVVRSARTYENNWTHPATFEARLATTESNSVAISWSHSVRLDSTVSIGYSAMLTGSGSMTFSNCIGQNKEHTKTVVIVAEDSVKMELQPGQVVHAKLMVKRYTITIRIRYRVTYDGEVWAEHDDRPDTKFKLAAILAKCNKKNDEVLTETIRLNYFTDAHIALSG